MKKPPSGRFFIDTNIAVYAVDSGDLRKQRIAREIFAMALQGNGCLSYQVVQEWFSVVLRKAAVLMPPEEATRIHRILIEPLWKIQSSRELVNEAIEIHNSKTLSWWDSLIVSAAIQGNCGVLLSEDLQHGMKIRGVRVENPFRS